MLGVVKALVFAALSLSAGERIEVREGHPKLFADEAEFVRLKASSDPLTVAVRGRVVAEADAFLGVPPVERVLEGRRLLTIARQAVARLLSLSMAWRMTDDRRYLERAKAEIRALCGFSDWNPSHFLDTAEAMFAVGVAYDWLYGELTEGERAAIRKALVEKGLKGGHENSRWMNYRNNWNLVCHTGYLAVALAIADEEPELSRDYVAAAVELMPLAIKSYEGGNFPEGPASYWPYATEYFATALAMLESACGTTLGLDRIPGVAEQTGYLDAMTGPTGLFFNYSDAGTEPIARPRGFTVASLYLARHFDAPESLVEFEMGALRRMLTAKPEGNTRRSYNRLMPLALFWLPKSEPKARAGRPTSRALGGSVPVASMRERWGDTSAAFVAVKGGGPGHSHAHQDGGSFVFDCDGVRWFWDFGSEDYHRLETAGVKLWDGGQDSPRWQVARYSLAWHNTLMIDGCRQRVRGDGVFVDTPASGFDTVTVDLTSLYTNATKVVRKVSLKGRDLVVRDRVETHPGATVTWTGIVKGSPRAEGRRLNLAFGGRTLEVVGSSDWALEDISRPPHDYESANPEAFRATMTATAGDTGVVEFEVWTGSDGSKGLGR